MTAEDNRSVAPRFIAAWDATADAGIIDALAAPDLLVTSPLLPAPLRGPAAFKRVVAALHAAFPDLRVTTADAVAEGDRVAIRWTLSGTHGGALGRTPPTGKAVAWGGISIYRLAGGKVAEEIAAEDGLGLLRQIGALPARADA